MATINNHLIVVLMLAMLLLVVDVGAKLQCFHTIGYTPFIDTCDKPNVCIVTWEDTSEGRKIERGCGQCWDDTAADEHVQQQHVECMECDFHLCNGELKTLEEILADVGLWDLVKDNPVLAFHCRKHVGTVRLMAYVMPDELDALLRGCPDLTGRLFAHKAAMEQLLEAPEVLKELLMEKCAKLRKLMKAPEEEFGAQIGAMIEKMEEDEEEKN